LWRSERVGGGYCADAYSKSDSDGYAHRDSDRYRYTDGDAFSGGKPLD
jgi:hypothetical protein